jgi:hypothetical protein
MKGAEYFDVITEEYNVMDNSDELIGTTECLTLYARCRIERCRYNRVRLYLKNIDVVNVIGWKRMCCLV